MELMIRRFDAPDEEREMRLGEFQQVELGGMTLGRASYEPGWKWSKHVGRALGQASDSAIIVARNCRSTFIVLPGPSSRTHMRLLCVSFVAGPLLDQDGSAWQVSYSDV